MSAPAQTRLKLPASRDDLAQLRLGDAVYLDGIVYTGREGVYRHVLEEGAKLPLPPEQTGRANFHCSPAASAGDGGAYKVGGVTATASFRFAKWMEEWFEISGANLIIGKGGMRARDYRELFVPAGAIYLTTVGYGTGALLGRGIRRVRDVFGWRNSATRRRCGCLKWKTSGLFWLRATSAATVCSNGKARASTRTLSRSTAA